MKVTVRFGETGVVVPCGDGTLLVSQLIEKAMDRYRKARGRAPTYWICVHTLKASGGGILDADDQLNDVADDNEQLLAVYEEQGGPLLDHNGGDGTSASSVGTSSPDIFRGGGEGGVGEERGGFRPYLRQDSKNDVIITQSHLSQGSNLIVRRGSEPVLTAIGTARQTPPPPPKHVMSSTSGEAPPSGGLRHRWPSAGGGGDQLHTQDVGDNKISNNGDHAIHGNGQIYTNVSNANGLKANHAGHSRIVGGGGMYNTQTDNGVQHTSGEPNSAFHSGTYRPASPSILSHEHRHRYQKNPNTASLGRPPPFAHREAGSGRSISQPEIAEPEVVREGEPGDIEQGTRSIPVSPSSSGAAPPNLVNSFARDSTRRSLANNAAMWKWLDAQEKTQERYEVCELDQLEGEDRKEPLGSSAETDLTPSAKTHMSRLVQLPNSAGPLGIHVVPAYGGTGRDLGLMIQGIEPGGRVFQDGRLQVHDRVIEINGHALIDVKFSRAQEIFKQALNEESLRLRVIGQNSELSPPSSLPMSSPPIRHASSEREIGERVVGEQGIGERGVGERGVGAGQSPMASPPPSPKKTPPPLPARHPTTSLSGTSNSNNKTNIFDPTNTKKIGKKINIELVKGPSGLGFSVTTRDNPAGGVPPIYIKKILPSGAAIQDGRLKPGDMLLQVNSVDMAGRSQSEAVALLRDTPSGGTITLLVSRIVVEEQEEEAPAKPRQLLQPQTSGLSSASSQNEATSAFASPASAFTPSHARASSQSQTGQPSNGGPIATGATTSVAMENKRAASVTQPSGDQTADALLTSSHAEVLALDIALPSNEEEDGGGEGGGGLGVSVKGKTSAQAGQKDLGIFIKDILPGGAAQKDGRLRINDQLVKVNGHSLLGVSNMVAMDTLRRAMQQAAVAPDNSCINHVIQLVVARRLLVTTGLNQSEPAGRSKSASTSSDVRISASSVSDILQTVSTDIAKDTSPVAMDKNANKRHVLDLNAARSGDGGVAAGMGSGRRLEPASAHPASGPNTAEHFRHRSSDGGALDGVHLRTTSGVQKPRPASTLGFQVFSEARTSRASDRASRASERASRASERTSGVGEAEEGAPRPPDWLQLELDSAEMTATDGPSPLEPVGFSREGFGRLSMSEKRKGHLDPRLYEMYNKIKRDRENRQQPYYSETWDPRKSKLVYEGVPGLRRAGSAESLASAAIYREQGETAGPVHERRGSEKDLGPTLGLKKSSSLESLQTAVQEVQEEEEAEEGFYKPHTNRGMVRGRGCNDSFRAAVDRSYDNQQPAETMETLDEESSDAGSNLGNGGLVTTTTGNGLVPGRMSRGSSFNDKEEERKKKKKEKKGAEKEGSGKASGGGLFSGLFKFGKNRKTAEDKVPSKSSSDIHRARLDQHRRDQPSAADQTNKTAETKHLEVSRQRDEHTRRDPSPSRGLTPTSARTPVPSENQPSSTTNQNAAAVKTPGHLTPTLANQHAAAGERTTSGEAGDRQQVTSSPSQHGFRESNPSSNQGSSNSGSSGASGGGTQNRSEHIQNIRARLQQEHRQRNGVFPGEQREELMEDKIQQIEEQVPSLGYLQHIRKQRLLEEQKKHGVRVPRPRDPSPPISPIRHDCTRSAAGVDPELSHYANLHEIREHLRYHDYLQQEHRSRFASQHPQAPPPGHQAPPPGGHQAPPPGHQSIPPYQRAPPPQPTHPAPNPPQAVRSHSPFHGASGGGTGSPSAASRLAGKREPQLQYSDPRVRTHPLHAHAAALSAHSSAISAHPSAASAGGSHRLQSRSADPRGWESAYSSSASVGQGGREGVGGGGVTVVVSGRSQTPGPPTQRSHTPQPPGGGGHEQLATSQQRAYTPLSYSYLPHNHPQAHQTHHQRPHPKATSQELAPDVIAGASYRPGARTVRDSAYEMHGSDFGPSGPPYSGPGHSGPSYSGPGHERVAYGTAAPPYGHSGPSGPSYSVSGPSGPAYSGPPAYGGPAFRHNSDYESSTRQQYTRERTIDPPGEGSGGPPGNHSYGSLPRQRQLNEKRYYSHSNLQPSLMSSSAQV